MSRIEVNSGMVVIRAGGYGSIRGTKETKRAESE